MHENGMILTDSKKCEIVCCSFKIPFAIQCYVKQTEQDSIRLKTSVNSTSESEQNEVGAELPVWYFDTCIARRVTLIYLLPLHTNILCPLTL